MDEFLKKLALLSQKYKIGIGGRGCCGSPFLYNLSDEQVIKENLEYKDGKYKTN